MMYDMQLHPQAMGLSCIVPLPYPKHFKQGKIHHKSIPISNHGEC